MRIYRRDRWEHVPATHSSLDSFYIYLNAFFMASRSKKDRLKKGEVSLVIRTMIEVMKDNLAKAETIKMPAGLGILKVKKFRLTYEQVVGTKLNTDSWYFRLEWKKVKNATVTNRCLSNYRVCVSSKFASLTMINGDPDAIDFEI